MNKKKTRILFLCPITIPLNSGAGRNVFNTCNKINNDRNFCSEILTFRNHKSLINEEVVEGVKIIRRKLFANTAILRRLSVVNLLPFLLKNIGRYDAYIIYGLMPGLFSLILLSKIFGFKVFYRPTRLSIDDVYSLCNKHGIIGKLRKYFFEKIDVHIAIQPMIHESYIKTFPKSQNSILLPQGVDTNFFHALTNKKNLKTHLGLPHEKIIIISIGFLIKRKGYDEIFNALKLLRNNNKNFIYIVIGDYKVEGSNNNAFELLKDEMKELYTIATTELKKNVLLLGNREREEIVQYLSAADIFLLQSKSEGLPNALLEAMSVGLPSIVSNLSGLEGFLTFDNENCLITRKDGPDELLLKLQLLIDNHNLRNLLGQKAMYTIKKDFSINKYVAALKKFINS